MSATASHRRSHHTAADGSQPTPAIRVPEPWLAIVAEKVRGLHFGVVQIVVHDSKVVQIERTERTRFEIPQTPHAR